ncbi:MAG TPA: twin-arginine translocase TatA/TatE family subunit [Anaerolineales bacterium]
MELLGIGPLELFFIVVIALILLGPKDMVKAGRTLGRVMRQVVTSPTWRTVQQTSNELRKLPNTLMREAGMEDLKDLKQSLPSRQDFKIDNPLNSVSSDLSSWTRNPGGQVEAQETQAAQTAPQPASPEPVIASPTPPEWISPPPAVEPEDIPLPRQESQEN